jgi:diaminohydroxyphosphoribosylaminopyrimidine deaminase/5-amino-6-(5-phosphoribosylamino)uracil reductase
MSAHRTRDTQKDEKFMRLALGLAEKAKGKTSPNPMVGAVVVKNGKILATGYHEKFGGPHAEATAIRACGKASKGATLYITLEPCCFFGKTPPCTNLIIESGIERVVCATVDPNPKVNGKGIRALGRNGVLVDLGTMRQEARRLNEVYFKCMATGLPFVLLSVAQSLDGRIIPPGRPSRGKLAGIFPAMLRSNRPIVEAILHDASEPGTDSLATILKSTDSARTRLILLGTGRQIDRKIKQLGKNTVEKAILVPTDPNAKKIKSLNGFSSWRVRGNRSGEVSLLSLLRKARKEGFTSILAEGGTRIATSLLKRKLVDKIWYFISPEIQVRGEEPFGDLGIRKISNCTVLRDCEYRQSKEGILITGYPAGTSG